MIVDYTHPKIAGLIVLLIVLWYNTQIVYSYLAQKDDEFRFQSQRKKIEESNEASSVKIDESISSINHPGNQIRKY